MLQNRSILIISPEPWQHIHVSKHHYARVLADLKNKVVFLNPPSGTWNISQTDLRGLVVVDYPKFLPGIRFFPAFLRRNLMRSKYLQIQSKCGLVFDMVWSFDNSVFFDFAFLDENIRKISQIVDLNQNFQLALAAKTANLCLGSSRHIVSKLKLYNPNSHFVHHGVQEGVRADSKVTLPGTNSLKAVYIGNLAMKYLDWKILHIAASENEEVDLIFIGPNGDTFDLQVNEMHEDKRQMMGLPNVYTLPQIDSAKISNYIAAADFLLIAYQESHHKDQANPHKMMEYLLSGKPILCTYTEEYLELEREIFMSRKNTDWPVCFGIMIHELKRWNNPELVTKRIDYAKSHTYVNQVRKIARLLETP